MGDMEMNILAHSWRRSVVGAAAIAVTGFVGTNSPPTNADERDVNVELVVTSNDEGDEEEVNVKDARLVVDVVTATGEPGRENEKRRRQYKDRIRNEVRRDRVEEIHKRIQDELSELPDNSRHEIAELIEALLRVERSHIRRELERGKVELLLRMKDNERQSLERALEQAKNLAQRDWKDNHEAALDQFRRAHEAWLGHDNRLHMHDDLVRRRHKLSPEAARNGDGGDRRQPGQIEDQLHELRDQMSQMHRQMSDMQRAMEKLMRSSEETAEPR
jgi:Mg2+ and Co2+ transporter CorA